MDVCEVAHTIYVRNTVLVLPLVGRGTMGCNICPGNLQVTSGLNYTLLYVKCLLLMYLLPRRYET